MAREFPRGTVTFLFTDIEDSTRLWKEATPATPVTPAFEARTLEPAIAT